MKLIKKIAFYTLIVFLLLFASAAVFIYYNADKIQAKALKEINKVVTGEVNVEGISIGFFKRFPKTTLILKNVSIKDPIQKERYLCRGADIYLDFNSLQILKGNYTLDRIGLEANFVRIKKHTEQWNFILWKTDSTNASSNFNVNLKSIDWQIDSLFLKIEDLYTETSTSGKIDFNSLSNLNTQTHINFGNINYKGNTYNVPESDVSILGLKTEDFTFGSANFKADILNFTATNNNAGKYNVDGECSDIKALSAFIQQPSLADFQGSIQFQFASDKMQASKLYNVKLRPVNVSIPKQSISQLGGTISVEDINKWQSASFQLKFKYEGQAIAAKKVDSNPLKNMVFVEAQNFTFPKKWADIDLSAENIRLNLLFPAWDEFFDAPEITSINVNDGIVKGVKFSSEIVGQFIELQGDASILNNALRLNNAAVWLNKKALSANVSMPGLKALLASQPNLLMAIEAKAETVDLNAFAPSLNTDTVNSQGSNSTQNLDFNISIILDAELLNYDALSASNVYLNARLNPNEIEINKINASVFDGLLSANGNYTFESEKLNLYGFANEISTDKLLLQFNNFNQSYISYSNFKGSADFRFSINDAAFTKNDLGNCKVYTHIYSAQLKNLPFLEDIKSAVKQNRFAKFILNEDELFRKLSFINLQEAKANFVLQNQSLELSDAIFRSPEINLNTQGTYNITNKEIDFTLQFFLKDFFAKSATENGYYVSDNTGSKLNLYLRGTSDNPDIGLLKRSRSADRGFNLKSIIGEQDEADKKPKENASTIFVIDESEEKSSSESSKKEESKKKKGFFKKLFEGSETIEDTSQVKFGIEPN